MKALKLALVAAAATMALGSAAHADDRPLGLTFNVGMATNYIFRGVSQTNDRAQVFGGADVTIAKIGYAGVWASNVDFLNGTKMEYDLYAGIKPTLGPVAFDFGVVRYGYTNKPPGPDEDYVEWKALASAPVGPVTLGAAYYYSDDFFLESGKAEYYEVNAALAIPNTKFSVSGAYGHQKVVGPFDYNTWNIGMGYAITDHVGLDVRYTDTSEHGFGDIYEPKFVGSLKISF